MAPAGRFKTNTHFMVLGLCMTVLNLPRVEARADPELENEHGRTPFDLAESQDVLFIALRMRGTKI